MGYLSEISPTALRGAVGTVYQLIITISILISQVLGMNNVLGNEAGWPFLLGLTIIPGILQLITLPFCPESPKYLLLEKTIQKAPPKLWNGYVELQTLRTKWTICELNMKPS